MLLNWSVTQFSILSQAWSFNWSPNKPRRSIPIQIEHDADNPATTLEHVLPEKPGENWPDFETDPTAETAYRLGNLTLLEADLNRKIGNAAFAVKQPVLEVSAFDMTRRIAAENAEWTIERLANRQRWMAQQAAAIWRIAQLDGRG